MESPVVIHPERQAYFRSVEKRDDLDAAQYWHAVTLTDAGYDGHQYLAYCQAREDLLKNEKPRHALLHLALRTYAQNAEDSLTSHTALKDVLAFDTGEIVCDSNMIQLQASKRYITLQNEFLSGAGVKHEKAMELMEAYTRWSFATEKLYSLRNFLESTQKLACRPK